MQFLIVENVVQTQTSTSFTALHLCRAVLEMNEMSVRPSVRPSVHLCVRPSDKRVNCKKRKETCTKIFIPHKRSFHLVFYEEEWLVGAAYST